MSITFRPLWWVAFFRNTLLLQAVLWLFMTSTWQTRVALGLAISVAVEVVIRLMTIQFSRLLKELHKAGFVRLGEDGVYELLDPKTGAVKKRLPGVTKRHLEEP